MKADHVVLIEQRDWSVSYAYDPYVIAQLRNYKTLYVGLNARNPRIHNGREANSAMIVFVDAADHQTLLLSRNL